LPAKRLAKGASKQDPLQLSLAAEEFKNVLVEGVTNGQVEIFGEDFTLWISSTSRAAGFISDAHEPAV
jgi:hypothetical protein